MKEAAALEIHDKNQEEGNYAKRDGTPIESSIHGGPS
jgi:hypothetical protein